MNPFNVLAVKGLGKEQKLSGRPNIFVLYFQNFVEQNPHWEINWIKDREKAFERCGKLKLNDESNLLSLPEPADKHKKHSKNKYDFYLDSSKEKKKKKKSKKRKKKSSSGSSSSSSSSDSSSEEDDNKSKSIRVAMRNKMRMQAQLILKEEMEGKLEALTKLVEEDRRQKEKQKEVEERQDRQRQDDTSKTEDNIINQWMTVSNSNNDKKLLEGLKGRLKQRQEQEREKAEQAAIEQRRQERLREERKLKEIREREQREREARFKEEREREERERMKEKERHMRRKERSPSSSPDRKRHTRSRSRSSDRSSKRSQERNYRKNTDKLQSPIPSYKTRTEEEKNVYEKQFEKQAAESAKKKTHQSSSKKLPFIGRMPLLKKRKERDELGEKLLKGKGSPKKEDYEVRLTKFEPLSSVAAFIPPPGVVHLPLIMPPPTYTPMKAEPPPPPKIIPEPPKISEDKEEEEQEAPPPPNITRNEPPENYEEEVQAPPPAPDVGTKSKGNHLHPDFQDALNIIYPADHMQDPNMMMQYQYSMGYGMMYPGMQMYDYTVQDQIMSNETNNVPPAMPTEDIPEAPPPPPVSNDDDLAMLGIDAGDMAAQTI